MRQRSAEKILSAVNKDCYRIRRNIVRLTSFCYQSFNRIPNFIVDRFINITEYLQWFNQKLVKNIQTYGRNRIWFNARIFIRTNGDNIIHCKLSRTVFMW